MRPDLRREQILGLVRARERMTVDALAELLTTSRETIRRDLTELAERGLVKKFHGGAAWPEAGGESAFQARMSENTREKRAIGHLAASLFAPGDTLFVDTGTTTVVFAEELARRSGLTVITNSLGIAQILGRSAMANRVFVIGGEYRDDAGENVGVLAIEQIARFHAAHAVITVGAIEPAGVMDFQLDEAEVARAMVGQARKVTVLADSSKLDRSALFQVCPLSRLDRLVVDRAPSEPLAEAPRHAEVEVLVAPPTERE